MIGYKDLVQYLKEQVGGNLKSFCPIIYSPIKFFDLDPSVTYCKQNKKDGLHSILMRNPKVHRSIPHGYAEFFFFPRLSQDEKTIFLNKSYCRT